MPSQPSRGCSFAALLVQNDSHECIVSGELHILWDALNIEFLRAAYKLIELAIRNSFSIWYWKRRIAISSHHMKFAYVVVEQLFYPKHAMSCHGMPSLSTKSTIHRQAFTSAVLFCSNASKAIARLEVSVATQASSCLRSKILLVRVN